MTVSPHDMIESASSTSASCRFIIQLFPWTDCLSSGVRIEVFQDLGADAKLSRAHDLSFLLFLFSTRTILGILASAALGTSPTFRQHSGIAWVRERGHGSETHVFLFSRK